MFDQFDNKKGKTSSGPFIIGRVKKIILGEKLLDELTDPLYHSDKDIGSIFFEPLYENKSNNTSNSAYSKPAYPMFNFIRQLPTIGEIVIIFPGPSHNLNDGTDKKDLWYLPAFNIWNSPNSNAFPNMNEYLEYVKSQLSKPGYDNRQSSYPDLPQGYTFQENQDIKTIRPFEGDTILQGRWGQSIRLGSTITNLKSINTWSNTPIETNGKPITIIVNSQKQLTSQEQLSPTTVEDINRDGSSIYMTSGQKIEIVDLNNFPIRSYSSGKSFDPQIQEVIKIEGIPTSNEFISPIDQDNNA